MGLGVCLTLFVRGLVTSSEKHDILCYLDDTYYKPCPGCWARTQAEDSARIDGTAVENSPIC